MFMISSITTVPEVAEVTVPVPEAVRSPSGALTPDPEMKSTPSL